MGFMGLWRKLLGLGHEPEREEASTQTETPPQMKVSFQVETSKLVQVAGTTTFSKDGALAVAERYVDEQGYAEFEALVLDGGPDVVVDGVRLGCLPTYAAQELAGLEGRSLPVTVQVFRSETVKGPRVDAWAWLGPGRPKWRYSRAKRPPVTTDERSRAAQLERHQLVEDGLKAGGERAMQFRRGMVDGFHYLELVEPIKQLKREGLLEEALKLCYRAIEGAERDNHGREPAPAYTLEAAIIHRKLKQREAEIAVLERWLRQCPPERRDDSEIGRRLAKLKQ